MSQVADFNSLDDLQESYPETEYFANTELLNDALRKLGKTKYDVNEYPDYYDSVLKQIIDLVPLE